MDNGWKTDHHIDCACRAGNFEGFIQRFLHVYRFGYVTSLYMRYVPFVDAVLKIDNLADDLDRLLSSWSYRVKEHPRKLNASSSAIKTKLSEQTRKKLFDVEKGIISYLSY